MSGGWLLGVAVVVLLVCIYLKMVMWLNLGDLPDVKR